MVVLCPHCDANGQHFMTYESRIQQIQDWLTECLESHQACKWEESSPPLPTRVLQLDLGDGSDDVRLLDAEGIQGKYAALTYCWGRNPDVIFKTESSNLLQNQVRIDFHGLSLLFREVVKILRSLGIIYLWIDALCIVQDSKTDWESEASKMAAVYSNAHLTVSASEATSPDDFQAPQYPIDTRHNSTFYGLEHVVDHGALSKRGWCLQERCLSRRIVHLGSRQLHWECPGATRDEHIADKFLPEIALGPYKRIVLGPKGFHNDDLPGMGRNPYRLWYTVLRNYGGRSLSFEKDRIPALFGMIVLFKKATGDTMVSGLWRADIPRGLLWDFQQTPQCDYAAEPCEPRTSPSWSWLRGHGSSRLLVHYPSHNAAIQIMIFEQSTMTITLQGKVFSCPPGAFWSTPHKVERVGCGSYEISTPDVSWDFLPESIGRSLAHSARRHGFWHNLFGCLRNPAGASIQTWVLVVVEPQGDYVGWGLMLVMTDQPETYRRVGLVNIFPLRKSDRRLQGIGVQYSRRQPGVRTIKLR